MSDAQCPAVPVVPFNCAIHSHHVICAICSHHGMLYAEQHDMLQSAVFLRLT